MLKPFAKLLICSVFAQPGNVDAALDEMRLLSAIAHVETGTTNTARACRKVGRAGERSAWQISRAVWNTYSSAPFTDASSSPRLASAVAAAHLRWLRLNLEKEGISATPFALALAWNAGLSAVLDSAYKYPTTHYAERVANLYHSH
jgi:hypothetical protein